MGRPIPSLAWVVQTSPLQKVVPVETLLVERKLFYLQPSQALKSMKQISEVEEKPFTSSLNIYLEARAGIFK
jgi:hypothetical protein